LDDDTSSSTHNMKDRALNDISSLIINKSSEAINLYGPNTNVHTQLSNTLTKKLRTTTNNSIQVNLMSKFGNTNSISQRQSTKGGTKDGFTLNKNVFTTTKTYYISIYIICTYNYMLCKFNNLMMISFLANFLIWIE